MYTFFAAGTDGSGIVYPIKLKVKEIGNDGQEIPANISNYIGDNIDGFSTLYDTVVLAVDEIEDLPGSARPPADKAAERKYPSKSSTVKIAELLELVKGDAEEYIPKQEIVRDIQINVQSMLGNLPQNATVHVQNENELAAVGATNNLRGLAANVKFISDGSITNQSAEVNQKHSRELETVEELTEQDELLKKYSPAQIREIIHLYAEAYGNVNMNAAQVLEEIVCDAMAEMNAFATEQMERVAGEVGRFLRDVQKAAKGTALEGGQKKNAREGVKRSMEFASLQEQTQREITENYQAEVDKVLHSQFETARQLIVGYTPAVYEKLGMPSLPLTIGSGHVYSIAKTEQEAKQDGNFRRNTHYHGLGDTAVKNIYDSIQDPVMVIAAKDVDKNAAPLRSTHSVVAIVDIGTAGKSLLVPIEITAERKVNGTRMDVKYDFQCV